MKQERQDGKPRVRRRRWWQMSLRIAVGAAMVLLAAYLLLPWYLPKDWLRQRIVQSLSEALDVKVEVGPVSVGWADGVEIQGLTIHSPKGFGPEPIVRVERIRCDFSPLAMLLRGRIEWMDLDRLRLAVRRNADGRLNVDVFRNLPMETEIGRLSVRQSETTVCMEGSDRPLVFRLSDLQVQQGRHGDLGQITLTGALRQEGPSAPVSVRVSAGRPDENRNAEVDFRFTNLDLEQIPLSALTRRKPPLRHLSGRCHGQLVFDVSRNLKIGALRLELLAENLEVEPVGAPKLPMIREAGLKMEAALDAFSQRADIRSLQLRVPGIDLSGRACVYADLLEGNWESIDSVHLEGALYPDRVAALLSGRETLGKDLTVRGPVQAKLDADRNAEGLALTLMLLAANAEIRRNDAVFKSPGDPLSLAMEGTLRQQDHAWPLDVEHIRFALGHNALQGSGSIADLAAFVPSSQAQDALQGVLRGLQGVRMRGDVKIAQVGLLSRLFAGRTGDFVHFRTPIKGQWSVEGGTTTLLSAGLHIDEKANLAVGTWFVQPAGEKLSVNLDAAVSAKERCVVNVNADVVAGRSRLSLRQGSLRLPQAEEPLEWSGEWNVEGANALTAWLPGLRDYGVTLGGSLRGSFQAEMDSACLEALGEIDLTELSAQAKGYLNKPAGQQASTSFHLAADFAKGRETWTLDNALRLAAIEARTRWRVRSGQGTPNDEIFLDLNVQDASCLEAIGLPVRKALLGGRLGGSLAVTAQARRTGPTTSFSFDLNSEKLDCVVGGERKLLNLTGRPVAVRLRGRATRPCDDVLRVEIEEAQARVSKSRIGLRDGLARLDLRGRGTDSPPAGLPAVLQEFSVEIDAACDAQEIGEALPTTSETIQTCGAQGEIRGKGFLQVHPDEIALSVNVDARDLGVRDVKGLAKPAGAAASVSMNASAARDFSDAQVRRLHVQLDQLRLDADLKGKGRVGDSLLPADLELTEANVRLHVQDAATFNRLLPNLQVQRLAGAAEAELEWRAGDGPYGRFDRLVLEAKDLKGLYRGKECGLDGLMRLENLRLGDGNNIHLGRFYTDDLAFHAGDNYGRLLADVHGKAGKPAGEFHVLLGNLDVRDVTDWLKDGKERPSGPLDEAGRKSVEEQADRFIAQAREILKKADLHGRLSAADFQLYDAEVAQSYPTKKLELELRARDGEVELEYDAGLFGGLVHGDLRTRLTEAAPEVRNESEYREVRAEPIVQAQISRQFPGNTVNGRVSRSETSHVPLRLLVANAIDPRCRVYPVGEAKLVATEGLVVGRAAPRFVTKIFPGLNLTKYPYDTMTAFTKLLPNGTTENETFFFGGYDVYMEGVTDADYHIQYTLGLVLLGRPFPAEALRDWKQGRVPILKVKGRIEKGRLVGDEVSYPLPNETLFEIFLKNNIVFRAWVNMQRAKQTSSP